MRSGTYAAVEAQESGAHHADKRVALAPVLILEPGPRAITERDRLLRVARRRAHRRTGRRTRRVVQLQRRAPICHRGVGSPFAHACLDGQLGSGERLEQAHRMLLVASLETAGPLFRIAEVTAKLRHIAYYTFVRIRVGGLRAARPERNAHRARRRRARSGSPTAPRRGRYRTRPPGGHRRRLLLRAHARNRRRLRPIPHAAESLNRAGVYAVKREGAPRRAMAAAYSSGVVGLGATVLARRTRAPSRRGDRRGASRAAAWGHRPLDDHRTVRRGVSQPLREQLIGHRGNSTPTRCRARAAAPRCRYRCCVRRPRPRSRRTLPPARCRRAHPRWGAASSPS